MNRFSICCAFVVTAIDCAQRAESGTAQLLSPWMWWIVGFVWLVLAVQIWFYRLERN